MKGNHKVSVPFANKQLKNKAVLSYYHTWRKSEVQQPTATNTDDDTEYQNSHWWIR